MVARNALLMFKLHLTSNGTFVASLVPNTTARHRDDVGALYYVVVIIFIYACSIVLMITSYIRKNKEDRRLKRYMKEMAYVRKRELRMSLIAAAAKAASVGGGSCSAGSVSAVSQTRTRESKPQMELREGGIKETNETGIRVWMNESAESEMGSVSATGYPEVETQRMDLLRPETSRDHKDRRDLNAGGVRRKRKLDAWSVTRRASLLVPVIPGSAGTSRRSLDGRMLFHRGVTDCGLERRASSDLKDTKKKLMNLASGEPLNRMNCSHVEDSKNFEKLEREQVRISEENNPNGGDSNSLQIISII